MSEDMSDQELMSQSKSKGMLIPLQGGQSPMRGLGKSILLPPI